MTNSTNGTGAHLLPTINWAQRDDQVFVTVAVEDIESPTIKLDENTLYFK